MRLRFHPHGAASVKWPGRGAGAYPYFGRSFDAKTRQNRATEEPGEVVADSPEGRRMVQLCKRDDALLPADEATAKFCGVRFSKVKRDAEGNWQRDAAPKASPKTSARPTGKVSD